MSEDRHKIHQSPNSKQFKLPINKKNHENVEISHQKLHLISEMEVKKEQKIVVICIPFTGAFEIRSDSCSTHILGISGHRPGYFREASISSIMKVSWTQNCVYSYILKEWTS